MRTNQHKQFQFIMKLSENQLKFTSYFLPRDTTFMITSIIMPNLIQFHKYFLSQLLPKIRKFINFNLPPYIYKSTQNSIIIIFYKNPYISKMNSKGFKNFQNKGSSFFNFNSGMKFSLPAILAGTALFALFNSFYYVDVGHYAIKFNKITGLSPQRYREGYNFKIPIIEKPIIYNVQTRQRQIKGETANRDMQAIRISVRVLFHPEVDRLDIIHNNLGQNYQDKILPAICNEILRTVVAQFSANQLLAQRDQVSDRIRTLLSERAAHFNIIIDNLAITDLTFMKEYLQAIESKQVAQQQAQRAKYEVEQARQAKKSTIIQAQASAKSIQLVGLAAMSNPSYLDVRKIEYTKKIAEVLSQSKNHILLNSSILNMELPKERVDYKDYK